MGNWGVGEGEEGKVGDGSVFLLCRRKKRKVGAYEFKVLSLVKCIQIDSRQLKQRLKDL